MWSSLKTVVYYVRRHPPSRLMVYGLLVGLLSGIGASLFSVALEWLTYFVLDYLAGFPLGAPASEHLVQNMPHGTPKLWLPFLAPAIGGLISGLIVYTWAPEAEGHGTDALIDAFHHKNGNIRTRIPLIKGIASIITVLLSRRWSIYEKQVRNKFSSPAHAGELTINVLQTVQVREVYDPGRPVTQLPMDMRFKELKRLMTMTRESFFPRVDDDFRLTGILSFPDLRPILFEDTLSDLLVVGELADKPASVALHESLYEALIKFIRTGYGQIPVVDDDQQGRLVGVLSLQELVKAYHLAILRLTGG